MSSPGKITREGLRAVLLDAGNTVVFLDMEAICEIVAGHAVSLEPSALWRAEAEAKRRYEALLAQGAQGEDAAPLHFRLAEQALVNGDTARAREGLLEAIDRTSERPFRVFSRYLHTAHEIPGSLQGRMAVTAGTEDFLLAKDRFPFYRLVPIVSS